MDNFFPAIIIAYLWHFRQAFSSTSFPYFQGFIVALLLKEGRKCVTGITSVCFFLDKSLASFERFLSQSQWDLDQLLRQLIQLCLDQLSDSLLYANRYLIAIDTTFVKKVRGSMLGVQKWSKKVAESKLKIIAHHWAILGLLRQSNGKWQCLPLLSRLISGKSRPSHFVVDPNGNATPMSFWDTTIAMVAQAASQISTAPLCVVADAYFAKAAFFNPLIEMGVGLVTRLRWDAVGWDDAHYKGRGRPPKRGKKWKLASLLNHLPHQKLNVTIYGKQVSVTCVVRDVWLRDVKRKIRVVVLSGVKHPILLASTSMSLTAKEIIQIYSARFSLEIAIRELKQHLGFCDYQATTTVAFLRFTQLCCCALSIARLILAQEESLPFLAEDSSSAISEGKFSFRKMRRCLRQFVLSRLLLAKSTTGAEFEKRNSEIEKAILSIAA